jgi:hypothetical protein
MARINTDRQAGEYGFPGLSPQPSFANLRVEIGIPCPRNPPNRTERNRPPSSSDPIIIGFAAIRVSFAPIRVPDSFHHPSGNQLLQPGSAVICVSSALIRVPSLPQAIRVNPCPSVVQNDQNHGCHGSTRIAKRENKFSPACLLCPHSRTSALKSESRAHGTHRIARNRVGPHHHWICGHSRVIRAHSRSRFFPPPARQSTSAAGIRGHLRVIRAHPRSIPPRFIRVNPWSKKIKTTDRTDTTESPPFPLPSTRPNSRPFAPIRVSFACHSRPSALKSEPCAHGTHGNSRIGHAPTHDRAPPDLEIRASRILLPRSPDRPEDASSYLRNSTLVRRNRRSLPSDASPETSRSRVIQLMDKANNPPGIQKLYK